MTLIIYHNPRCSKSRRTLEIIREHGIEPDVVHYLEDMPDATRLLELSRMLGKRVAGMLREGEPAYREAGKAGKLPAQDADLAEWLSRHPAVLQRPIVVDPGRGRAVIGRPPEKVLDLIERPAGE